MTSADSGLCKFMGNQSLSWKRNILILCFACFLPALVFGGTKPSSSPSPAIVGQWAAPVNFCTYPCLVGANAAVLNTGKVLFYYYPAANTQNSQAMVLDPVTGNLTNVALPVSEDIFCSGLSILSSGKVLVTGGNVEGVKCSHTASGCGTKNVMIFDPSSSTWSTGNDMNDARWYPSSIELTDGTLLELSGTNETGQFVQLALEKYNLTSGNWAPLPGSANLPGAVAQVYPRLSLLPSGKVFLSSPAAKSYQFDPTANRWTYVATVNFGFRYFAPHVLLPGQEKILVAGGTSVNTNGGGAATNTVEVIDMSAAAPAWSYTGSMTYARYNENLVLLADGTVLAVGGGGGGGRYTNPVFQAELYDPTTGLWSVMASQKIQRTYHSTAVLLPDGRVVSAGSDNGAAAQVTYEIYSPPYLFKGPRPVIQTAPTSLTYNSKFEITTPNATSITRVALVRPGATTHADNFDQRYVDLAFTVGSGTITATAPANGSEAPPGYYMLVVVNSNGVPSVMPFLELN
ncbi:MAG TPA: galactose oxidase-like domain-containing protein [Candidatus Sulfotelmatobacter sp.]|nr:galactose oxidase-like domain-containing protein [Candidatus Sulfotelmatobacter sp.]